MKTHSTASFAALAACTLVFAACNRPPETVEVPATPPPAPVARIDTFETHELRLEINTFAAQPSATQAARVEEAFAEIDGEIAELARSVAEKGGSERDEAARKLADLTAYRDAERIRFTALLAKAQPPIDRGAFVTPVPSPGTFERVGNTLDEAAEKVREEVKDVADEIRD